MVIWSTTYSIHITCFCVWTG